MWWQLLLVYTSATFATAESPARWRLLADDAGHGIHLVNTRAPASRTEPQDVVNNVTFLFYSRNENDPLVFAWDNVSELTSFDSSLPTALLAHGWESTSADMDHIKNAFLSAGDYNVISIDWSQVAANVLYTQVMADLVAIGRIVAGLLDWLVTNHDLDPGKLHLIGHSLGAHVVGVAGGSLASEYEHPKAAVITGLDPAGPGYEEDESIPLEEMLDIEDAEYVQVIHTNTALLGMSNNVGHSDFFPNGGYKQAGCGNDWFGTCSHSRSTEYFAESLTTTTGFIGFQCDDWDNYDTCYGRPWAFMGAFINVSTTSGVYYMNTAATSPYALGYLG